MKTARSESPAISIRTPAPLAGIQLFLATVGLDGEVARLADSDRVAWLGAEENAILCRFHYDKRRREWLGGRLAAKKTLQAATGEEFHWPDWQILPDTNGRPRIYHVGTEHHGLHVSISHSGGFAAALLAGSACCGLDIQTMSQTIITVKDRFITSEEIRLLDATLGHLPRLQRLTLAWSAKEAVRKADPGPSQPNLAAIILASAEQRGENFLFAARAAGLVQPVRTWVENELVWAVTVNRPAEDF